MTPVGMFRGGGELHMEFSVIKDFCNGQEFLSCG